MTVKKYVRRVGWGLFSPPGKARRLRDAEAVAYQLAKAAAWEHRPDDASRATPDSRRQTPVMDPVIAIDPEDIEVLNISIRPRARRAYAEPFAERFTEPFAEPFIEPFGDARPLDDPGTGQDR